jgi:hypothetical protein
VAQVLRHGTSTNRRETCQPERNNSGRGIRQQKNVQKKKRENQLFSAPFKKVLKMLNFFGNICPT